MSYKPRDKPFVCVDCDLPNNARIEKCEDPVGCLGLWTALLCYARMHMTDGLVPKKYALRLHSDRRNTKRVVEMLREGLLADHGEDLEVLRYSPRNQTRAEIEAVKKKARDKVKKWREDHPGYRTVTGNTEVTHEVPNGLPSISISTSLSDLSSLGSGSPSLPSAPMSTREPMHATDDGVMGYAVAAFAEGVTEVTGRPFVLPPASGLEMRKLVKDIVTLCPMPTEREAWARAAAIRWATGNEVLTIFDFHEWLNRGEREKPSGSRKVVKLVQTEPAEGPIWKMGTAPGGNRDD